MGTEGWELGDGDWEIGHKMQSCMCVSISTSDHCSSVIHFRVCYYGDVCVSVCVCVCECVCVCVCVTYMHVWLPWVVHPTDNGEPQLLLPTPAEVYSNGLFWYSLLDLRKLPYLLMAAQPQTVNTEAWGRVTE